MINVIKNNQNKIIALWSHGNNEDAYSFFKTKPAYKEGCFIACISKEEWQKHCETSLFKQALKDLISV